MISELKPQDDSEYKWIDKNGTSFRTKSEYIQSEILHLCGCGTPESIMVYIRDFLQGVKDNKYGDYNDMPHLFLCYWSDHENITEHGTSIMGCWLTDKGHQLLEDINWCINNEFETETA